jgi:hypothetical protein
MTSIVEGFMLKALHVFQVRTLQTMGFATRITLSNKSQNKGPLATDYRVDLTVYSPDGVTSTHYEGIAHLPTDEAVRIDCTRWQSNTAEDQVMIFHLMPKRLLPSVDGVGQVNIDRGEIWSLFTAQDHYVEYYRPDGFSSGVLYQSGAFNYRKFSREESTVIQAPKVFLTSTLDTVLSILHTSFESDYHRDAILHCCLLSESAQVIAQWKTSIKPFTACSISIKEVLLKSGVALPNDREETQVYTLLGLCDNAALMPLVLNFDATHETLAVEHSLPPMYYGSTVTGPVRAQMITELRNCGMFPDVGA